MILRTVDIRKVGWLSVGLVGLAVAGAGLSGVGQAASIAFGGAYMFANYHLIRMLVSRLISPAASAGAAQILLAGKLLLAFLLVVGVFAQFPVDPMSFALGATMLPAAAVLEAVWLGQPIDPLD